MLAKFLSAKLYTCLVDTNMCLDTSLWKWGGGRFGKIRWLSDLTNYDQGKRVTENSMSNRIPNLLQHDQLSYTLVHVEGVAPPIKHITG